MKNSQKFSTFSSDCLMKKNEELLPTEAICRELALLCNRVTSALEALIVDPGEGCPGIADVKVRVVKMAYPGYAKIFFLMGFSTNYAKICDFQSNYTTFLDFLEIIKNLTF